MDMWTVRRAAKRAACRGQRYNRCPPRHPLTTNPQTPKTKIFFLERGSKAKPVRSSPQRLRRALCTHCSGRPARTSRIHVPEFRRCPCQHFSKPANNPVSFLIGECRCISHQPFTATQQNVLFGETRTGTHRLCLFSEHAGHVGSNVPLQPRVFDPIQGCLINQPCQLSRGSPISTLRNKAGRRINND